MSKILYIKLTQLQLNPNQISQKSYFSFFHSQQHYFSSVISQQNSAINDDIIINVGNQIPQYIILHRWQKHMILFTHIININELRTRSSSKKKWETKYGEILSFTICLLDKDEIPFSNKYIESISQHYLKITNMEIKNQKNRVYQGPCYFLIATDYSKYYIPVINSVVYIHIPTPLQFMYYRTGQLFGKSEMIDFNSIKDRQIELTLQKEGYYKGQLKMQTSWGINLKKTKLQNNLLTEAHEIMFYDIEVKFDNFNEFTNCKVKLGYGNKGFELIGDYNNSKITKFKKIIHFMIRSQQEEVLITVEKNSRPIVQEIFLTDQVIPYQVNTINKKFHQVQSGRLIGNIKFKSQKGKNLSIPSNNELWKQLSRKKTTANFIICIDQLSVKYEEDIDLMVLIKVNQIQYKFYPVTNFKFFEDRQEQKQNRVLISAKSDQSIYIIMRKYQKDTKSNVGESDFIGIAVINSDILRIGQSVVSLPFFKNQQQTALVSFQCNKIVPYQFLKPIFLPQSYNTSTVNSMNISLFINKIVLTPYYHTYKYDGKNELYCIAQVNRIKKVLILQSSQHDQLTFIIAGGSDNLNYIVDDSQYVKVKFIFLVSDVGHEEQIYGTFSIKVKTSELVDNKSSMNFNNNILKNEEGNEVGRVSLQMAKSSNNNDKAKLPPKPQKIKLALDRKVNKSVQIDSQIKLYKPKQPRNQSRKYSGSNQQRYSQDVQQKTERQIKLPTIKQGKKDKLQKVFSMLRVRKRGVGGVYDQTHNSNSLNSQQISKIQEYKSPIIPSDRTFNLKDIQKNNPNLDKNFEMLFPKKMNDRKIRFKEQNQQKNYKQLKGLKSVYEEISNDIGQVQPTVKSSRQNQFKEQSPPNNINFNNIEWEGNQFAQS